jgi:hypothetical protein
MSPHWFDDVDEVAGFGMVLDLAGEFDDKGELAHYMQKPFQWDDEFEQWVNLSRPTTESENWDEFVTYLEER